MPAGAQRQPNDVATVLPDTLREEHFLGTIHHVTPLRVWTG
jgi:hypothetical protein